MIAGCTDYFTEAQRIEVQKGIYRVRIYYGNLDKLSEDGLDGDDFYEIHMWLSNRNAGIKVIKEKNASTQHSS